MLVSFEWDPQKSKNNLQKHQVDFEEACTIFNDPLFITFLDDEHFISARKATENEEKFYQETG